MKLLGLYKWATGSMSDFTKPFENNDALFNQAKAFWHRLDDYALIFIVIFIILGIGLAYIYYKPFNEKSGRHYKPSYWLVFLIGSFIVTLFLTYIIEMIVVHSSISGASWLEFKVAFGNAVYAALLYFITSVVCCRFLKTNAYKIF